MLGFAFAMILGAGTLGGTANVKGVFAGVPGGVGGLPIEGAIYSVSVEGVSRGFRNISSHRLRYHFNMNGVMIVDSFKPTLQR